MAFKILAADIGGTHSRFAAFEMDEHPVRGLVPFWRLTIETRRAGSFDELLSFLAKDSPLGRWENWDRAVFALPGPVSRQKPAPLPNVPWCADISGLKAIHGRDRFVLVNDFTAQAWFCLHPNPHPQWIREKTPEPGGVKAVMGAGTGLGQCALVPDNRGGCAFLMSEAGHTGFAFCGKREKAFEDFLLKQTGRPYVTGDMVVTGPGLARLHRFLTGQDLSPRQVTENLAKNSPTRIWFSRFYGRAARHFALAVLPLGGMIISGGVAAHHPALVDSPEFLSEFSDHWVFGGLLSAIPIQLQTDPEAGLKGAALYGLHTLTAEKTRGQSKAPFIVSTCFDSA